MTTTNKEPRGEELIRRYKKNYSIPADAVVTEEMILQHWNLEKELTKELLKSTRENRWKIFERAYGTLYRELEWLNKIVHTSEPANPEKQYSRWLDAIGITSLNIYEVGSGKGAMIKYLAKHGHYCTATEITTERGALFVSPDANVQWVITDGVHLDLFEEKEKYDIILSDQVIEHFHPDDIYEHFQSAYKILKPGGRYIFSTPHLYSGPHDVSLVFGCSSTKGMHLREYTFRELIKIAKTSGFTKISYAYKFTDILQKTGISSVLKFIGLGSKTQRKIVGFAYLRMLLFSEWLLGLSSSLSIRRKMTTLVSKIKLFNSNIFLEIQKEI
jgi:SAM-dependent methyltransferase